MKQKRVIRFFIRVLLTLGTLCVAIIGWNIYLNYPPHCPTYPQIDEPDNTQLARVAATLFDLNVGVRISDGQLSITTSGRPFPLNEVQKEVQANAGNLRKLHEHLSRRVPMRAFRFAKDYYRLLEQTSDENRALRRCEELLLLEAYVKYRKEDWPAACHAALDHLRILARVSYPHITDSTEPSCLILHHAAQHLTMPEARKVAQQLDDIIGQRKSFAQIIDDSRPITQYDVVNQLREESIWYRSRWSYGIPNINPSALEDRTLWQNEYYAWTVPNHAVPGRIDRYLKACAAAARHPYCEHAPFPTPPPDIFSYSGYGRREWDVMYLQQVMQNFRLQGTQLNLAVYGYQKAHGQFPRDLRALVNDEWVKRLPSDPFTGKDTLCYRLKGNTFVLYSRGPDGKDDGGSPIINIRHGYLKHNYVVRPDSRGDVVFGINMQAQMHTMYL